MSVACGMKHRCLWMAAAAAALLQPGLAEAADFTWTPTASSNLWSLDTNWSPATNGGPDAPGLFVLINPDIANGQTNVLFNTGNAGDAVKTVGRLDLGDANATHSLILAAGTGAGSLEFNGNGSNAQLNQLSTSKGDTISAPITNSSALDIHNASPNLLTLGIVGLKTNTLTLTGSNIYFSSTVNGTGPIVINSSGSARFGPANSSGFSGGVTLNSGTLIFEGSNLGGNPGAGSIGTGILSINGGSLNGAGNIGGNALTIIGQVWNTNWTYLANRSLHMGYGAISLGNLPGGSSNRTITVNGTSSTLTLGGGIVNGSNDSAATGLTKAGTGPLLLLGTNTYTGPTTVSAGILQMGRQVALYSNNPASWTASNIIVNSGAILALSVGGSGEFTAGDLDVLLALGTASGGFQNGAIVGLDTTRAGVSFTYGGVLADPNVGANALGLSKLSTNALVLTGANTYSGGTTINAGTVQLSGAGTLGAGPVDVVGGTLDINSLTKTLGGTLTLGGGTAPTVAIGASGALTLGGDVTYDSAGNSVATISGNALNLGVPRTFMINDGTQANDLTVNAPISDGNGIFDVTKAGAGTLLYTPGITTTGDQALAVNAGTLILSGPISGGHAVTKTGAGTLKLTGSTDLELIAKGASPLLFDSSATTFTGTTRAASVTLRSSTLSLNGNASSNTADIITGALICDAASPGGADLVTITPAGRSTQLSVGTLARTNGAVAFFTGTSLGAAPGNGVATLTFTNPPTAQLVGGDGGAGSTTISILPWAAGSTTAGGGPASFVTYDNAVGLRPLDTVTEYATATNFSGTASANNVRLGNLTTTTISNATTINSLYMVNTDGSLQTYLNGTGTLTITSGAIFLSANKGCTISANLNFGTAQAVIGYSKGKTTFISGGLAGSGGVVFYQVNPPFVQGTPGSCVTMSGAATYTGDTYVHGRVDVSSATLFPSGARSGDLYNFGLINLNASARLNGLFGDGGLSKNNSGTTVVTVGDNNATAIFNGVIANNGTSILGLTKIGSGSQTLNGVNTYTAATLVSNGVLAVNGSLASPVTVSSNAVLTGTGLVATNNAMALTVNAGGILDPGAVGGVGTLSVTGNVTFATNAVLQTDVAGTNADRLAVSGAVTAPKCQVKIAGAGSPPWKVLTAAGGITGTFSTDTPGLEATIRSGTELWVGPRASGTLMIIR